MQKPLSNLLLPAAALSGAMICGCFLLAPSEARAECTQSGRNVDCSTRDNNGFVSTESLTLHVAPGVFIGNVLSAEVVGSCPLSLPGIGVGPSSQVLNEGLISTFGVCGFGIMADRNSSVTNPGDIRTHDYISIGILSGDNGAIRHGGLISTQYQGSTGILGGDGMRVTVEAGGTISTVGQGAHGIDVGARSLVTNDGAITARGDTAFGISAAASVVINNGRIETSANNSIGVRIVDGTLTNTGLIRSVLSGPALAPTPTIAVSIAGNETHFANTANGAIEATYLGVRLDGANNSSLSNAGRIEVSPVMRYDGTALANSGAILVAGSAPVQITNSGTIVAHGGIPALLSLGSRVSLANSGTITGDILLGSGDDLVTFHSGSAINGTIDFGSGTDLLIFPGGGVFTTPVLNLELFSKSGAGDLILARDLAIRQQLNIFDGGGLVINPGVRLTSASTGNLGLLRGGGLIDGMLTNSGLIAPGTEAAKDTLTITGAFQQFTGGTLAIRLSPDGSSDKLVVGGPLTLAGTLALTYDGAGFRDGQRFDVLAPLSGSLSSSGHFTIAAPELAFVKAVMVTTSSGGVAVEIDRLSYSTAAVTEGQRSIGRLFDELRAVPPAALRATLAQMDLSAPGAATNILENFAPEAPGGVQNLGLLTLERFSRSIQHRASFDASVGHFAWARGFSSTGRSRGIDARATYDLHGAIGGVDMAFDGLRLGIAAARTGGDFARGVNAASLDASLVALTVGTQWGGFDFDAAIAYGHGSPELRRMRLHEGISETLTNEADSDLWSAGFSGSYNRSLGPVVISPHAGGAYHRVKLSAIDENGALAVRTKPNALTSLRARIGAGVSAVAGRLRPYGDLSISVELLQRMPRIPASLLGVPGSDFELNGDARRRVGLEAEAGLAVAITPGLEGHVAGNIAANDLLAGRALTAGLTLRW